MIAALIGIAYLLVLLETLIFIQSFRYARRQRRTKRDLYAPRAVILAPHYGWEANTGRNARLLLEQDYPGDYEVIFVTHELGTHGSDESYKFLTELAATCDHAQVLLAPNIVDHSLARSQKVQNLLTAMEEICDDVEAIAFVDADCRIRKDWLRQMVEPLQDEKIGATVGARYYVPHSLNVASLVEAVWTNFQLFWQGDHRHAMVWGGSNAIRRTALEEGRVLQRWASAAFEDHHLTHAVRDLGRTIHFVPECIVITETKDRTWRQVLEFTNRQILVTYRMGLRQVWGMILGMFLPKAFIVFGLLPFVWSSPGWLAALLAVPVVEASVYLVSGLNLPRWLREEPGMRWSHVLSSAVCPLAMAVAVLNSLNAIFRRQIVWGGVRYLIPSASECHVLGREAE